MECSVLKKNIYFPSFGTKLGFANSAFQYLFISHLSKLFSFNLILGSLDSNRNIPKAALFPIELFDINDYGACKQIEQPYYKTELSRDRLRGYYKDILKVEAFLSNHKLKTLEISGFFQYHTALMSICGLKNTFYDIYFAKSKKDMNNEFQNILFRNKQFLNNFYKNSTLIVCHIRLGDYKIYEKRNIEFIYTNDIEALIEEVKDFIKFNYIRNSKIYIASDSLEECIHIFQQHGINPLTIKSFFPDIDLESSKALMFDLANISVADIFYASNSSFSLLGSLLNTKQALFFRPSPTNKKMIGYLPWNTQILFKKSSFYPSSI